MSTIQDFYSNQTIFLTGATGFLGKLIAEKLLRSCPDLKKIYLLVRERPGKTLDERFNDIFNAKCFDVLKSQNPNFLNKVSILSGDCSKPVLGLSPEALEILKDEVTCIIHSAANVRFDTDLRTAVYTNVRSVKDLLDLMKDMKNIKAFVYVSTAFSHCLRKKIGEEFYDVDVNPEKLLKMVEVMDDKMLDMVTKPLLGDQPNTYVYTKALAEEVIRQYKQVLPVSIVRPCIVTSSLTEPIPGWIDNFHGIVGVITGSSLGVLRSLQLERKYTAMVVPVDFVVNAVIASAWNIQNSKNEGNCEDIPIYNVVPHNENSVKWGWFIDHFKSYTFVYPLSKAVWYQYIQTSPHKTIHQIRVFFYHTLFAYLVDSILCISGKSTLAVHKYRKINKLIDLVAFFTTHSWEFGSDNAQRLWKKLNEEERQVFNFNMRELDWKQYIHACIVGGRVHLMKDPLDTVPKAMKKMHLLRAIHYVFVGLVIYFWYLLFSFIFKLFFNYH